MTVQSTGKTAIVHEWVASRAGSEKVFEALAQHFPEADLWALSVAPGVRLNASGREIRTTFLDRDSLRNRRQLTLPLMPLAWRYACAPAYDTVITSHHAFAKSFRPARKAIHFCYVHTPARYVWSPELEDRGRGLAATMARPWLKRVDRSTVRFVDSFAANSRTVADRVQRYWGRSAEVIHPPVDTEFFTPANAADRDDYILSAGRFVEYKRHDLAIEVASATGRPLVIAGSGPDEARLRDLARRSGAEVVFDISPTDTQLRDWFRRAAVLVHLGVEDFGILPVEAMACGAAVVALEAGGCTETVANQVSGVLVENASADSIAAAVETAASLSGARCVERASAFSYSSFHARIDLWVSGHEVR